MGQSIKNRKVCCSRTCRCGRRCGRRGGRASRYGQRGPTAPLSPTASPRTPAPSMAPPDVDPGLQFDAIYSVLQNNIFLDTAPLELLLIADLEDLASSNERRFTAATAADSPFLVCFGRLTAATAARSAFLVSCFNAAAFGRLQTAAVVEFPQCWLLVRY